MAGWMMKPLTGGDRDLFWILTALLKVPLSLSEVSEDRDGRILTA